MNDVVGTTAAQDDMIVAGIVFVVLIIVALAVIGAKHLIRKRKE